MSQDGGRQLADQDLRLVHLGGYCGGIGHRTGKSPYATGQMGSCGQRIALHGKDGNAGMMLDLGVESRLQAPNWPVQGKPAFAVVENDGGNDLTGTVALPAGTSAMVLDTPRC